MVPWNGRHARSDPVLIRSVCLEYETSAVVLIAVTAGTLRWEEVILQLLDVDEVRPLGDDYLPRPPPQRVVYGDHGGVRRSHGDHRLLRGRHDGGYFRCAQSFSPEKTN